MNDLTYYLRQTPAITVNVNFDQVAELIGEERAKELAIFEIELGQIRDKSTSFRSAIPEEKRKEAIHLAGFNLANLLAAIDEAKGVDFQRNDVSQGYTAVPNVDLLNKRDKRTLVESLANKGIAV